MLSIKQKCWFRTRLKYVEWPLPGVQTVGATLREMRVRKGRGRGVMLFFPDPLYYQKSQLLRVEQKTAG